MTPRQIQVPLKMTSLSFRSEGALDRRGPPEVARCATASISWRRTKYQLRCELPRWMTLWTPPNRNQMTPSTDEISSESDALAAPFMRSTRQKMPAPSCTVFDRNEGTQDECGSLSPRYKRVCAYAALPPRKTCQFRTHKCRPQSSPTESCDQKIKGACVHPGSRTKNFEKWTDNRLSCLKHTGNLTHFSCKCPAGKRYKTWKAAMGGGGSVRSRRFTKLLRASQQPWRQRRRRRRRRSS